MPRWQDAPVFTPDVKGMVPTQEASAPKWQQAPLADLPKEDQDWWGMRAVKGIASAAQGAYETAFPERDPETKNIPGFSGQGLRKPEDLSRLERSKLTAAGFEDKPWRKSVMETLGDRVTGLRQDKFGNEIVAYKGDDGKDYETYVNRPGLDWTDVDRGATGILPYVVGAGVTNRLLGPAGKYLLARAPAQAVTAGGISVGQDVAADQPVSLEKAAITAGFGGAGEVAGTLAAPVWRWLTQPRFVDEATGTLTKAGRKQAERLGLDPDQVQGEVANRLAEIRRAKDPQAAAAGIETGEFGIPTTVGQRTKDPDKLMTEEFMRRSGAGPGAREVMIDFDQAQRKAIQDAADTVRGRVAPLGADDIPSAGQGVSEGMRAAQAASRKTVQEAWEKVGALYPILTETKTGASARNLLTQNLRGQFDDLGFFPDEQLTPNAHKMMKSLTDYSKAMPEKMPYPLLGDPAKRAPALDAMRRRLLKQYQNAAPGQDKAAARAIYAGFNDWMEDVAAKQLVRGEGMKFVPKTAAKPMEDARKITRQQRELLEPRSMQGRMTPAGKILTEIAENSDTPERAVQTLFGASTQTTPKAGTVGALKRMKIVLPPDKFDQVKAAYFLKMVTASDGKLLTPTNMNNSINKTFEKQRSVVDQLFSKSEQEFMQKFRKAIETAVYKDPNPSGSGYTVERLRQGRKSNLISKVFRRMGAGATIRGDFWEGSIWYWLADKMPNIFGMQDMASRSLARKAITQKFDFKPDSGNLMAAIAAAHQARAQGAERDQR